MYKKDILKNGLKVITSNMRHMESASMGIWIGVGGRYEEKKVCGMSHLIEHMLFKGTTSRTANVLKEAIEGVGGTFNGFTGENETCYLVKLPSAHTELGLDILGDMVLNPKMDPVELEKEKFVICEEIKMYMDQPAHHVFDILAESMWPNHALGRPIAGYVDTVKRFTKEDIINFKDRYYQPANMVIAAAGKIDRKKILKLAKNIFFMPSIKKTFPCKVVGKSHKGARMKFSQKDIKQAHIALGFHSIKRSHKLRYALALLNIILGGNMSSRLFEKLREQMALCYDISSSVKQHKETGAFFIHAGVDNDKFYEAIKGIVRELKDINKNPVRSEELGRAKEYARGQILLAFEDTAARMLWLGEKIISEGKAPSIKEIFRNIDKVTAEEVKKIASMVLRKGNLNFASVGPVKDREKKKLSKVLAL